jgi:hypothetical protein
MREAFFKSKNWIEIFESDQNYRFDEKAFSKLFLKHKKIPVRLRNLFSFINPVSAKCYFHEQYSTPDCRIDWVDGSRKFPTEWEWNEGELRSNTSSRQFMYFHFLFWKQNFWKIDYKADLGHLVSGEALSEVDQAMLGRRWVVNKLGFTSA